LQLQCPAKSCPSQSSEPELARLQNTLGSPVSFSGIGLFTGLSIQMKIFPAKQDSGVVFQRIDLKGKPLISATLESVFDTPRCTVLGDEAKKVMCVEHLLSALRALEIDNVLIQLTGPEVIISDGSALEFIKAFQKAGVVPSQGQVKSFVVQKPIYWSKGKTHLVVLPSNEFRVSYTLSYPDHPLLHSQYYSFRYTKEEYIKEIAPCRTFSLYEEIVPLIERGIIKGGSLNSGVVIKGSRILAKDDRGPLEMCKHKILDLIGDLSLIKRPIIGHIIAIRSGHACNVSFAQVIAKNMMGR
jgi:UDP-3-O-[3-hydroxymyristoyl] N-acetylglucosamine deacetylase